MKLPVWLLELFGVRKRVTQTAQGGSDIVEAQPLSPTFDTDSQDMTCEVVSGEKPDTLGNPNLLKSLISTITRVRTENGVNTSRAAYDKNGRIKKVMYRSRDGKYLTARVISIRDGKLTLSRNGGPPFKRRLSA